MTGDSAERTTQEQPPVDEGGAEAAAAAAAATATTTEAGDPSACDACLLNCPGVHGLAYITVPKDSWACNVCLVAIPKGSGAYGCRQCDYDICTGCGESPDGDVIKVVCASGKDADYNRAVVEQKACQFQREMKLRQSQQQLQDAMMRAEQSNRMLSAAASASPYSYACSCSCSCNKCMSQRDRMSFAASASSSGPSQFCYCRCSCSKCR